MKRQSFAALSKQNILSILRSSLFENTVILYFAHFAKYVFPLATLPYLARVLGAKTWGVLAFAQAFAIYLTMAIEYGFDLSATREAARIRDSRELLGKLFVNILGARVLIAIISIAFCFAIEGRLELLKGNSALYWWSVFWGASQATNLYWFFQALERMRTVAILDITSRLLSTAGIFYFVSAPEDVWKASMLYGLAGWIVGVASLIYALPKIKLCAPSITDILSTLKKGYQLFLHRLVSSFMTFGTPILIGLLTTPQAVGYYSAADKIITALRQLSAPAIQALYPRMAQRMHQAPCEAVNLFRKAFAIMSLGGFLLTIVTFFGALPLVSIILGKQFLPAITVVRILAIVPFVSSASLTFGTQWLMPLGMEAYVNLALVISAIFNVVSAILFVPTYHEIGMAYSVVICQIFLLASNYMISRIKNVDPFSNSISARLGDVYSSHNPVRSA
jgi:PST family polysaccharide transporter